MMKQLSTLAASLVLAGSVGAATISYSSPGALAGVEINQTMTLQLFDDNLGILTGAKLTRSASMAASGTITNSATDGSTASGSLDFLVTPVFDDGSFPQSLPFFAPALTGLFAYDLLPGSLPFAAFSSESFFDVFTDFADQTLLDLLTFSGLPQFFSLSCSSVDSSVSLTQDTGSIGLNSTLEASCGASIEYTYSLRDTDPTVPEPGTMALVGLALAGMGFVSRRRKAA